MTEKLKKFPQEEANNDSDWSQGNYSQPRMLTPSEIEYLRQSREESMKIYDKMLREKPIKKN